MTKPRIQDLEELLAGLDGENVDDTDDESTDPDDTDRKD